MQSFSFFSFFVFSNSGEIILFLSYTKITFFPESLNRSVKLKESPNSFTLDTLFFLNL